MISRLNKRLHEEFQAWRERDLSEEGLVFLYLDALYGGVRFGTSEKEAILVAHGVRRDGSRSVLAILFGGQESQRSRADLLHDLRARKLPLPLLVICDGNKGLLAAVREVRPDLLLQRCVRHKTMNVLDKFPKSTQGEVRKALNRIWYAEGFEAALEAAEAFMERYGRVYESATESLLEGLPECLTFFKFPEEYWRRIRTSNLLERTFKEVRRRTRVVGRFPTETSALAVIYGILTIESTKWRGLRIQPAAMIQLEQISAQLSAQPIVLDLGGEAA